MQMLNIAVVPSENGMITKRLTADTYVQQAMVEPYYWTLDVPEGSPANTPKVLMSQMKLMLKDLKDVTKESNLHVTLRYKSTPGPDPLFQHEIEKMSAQTVQL